ncbi:MAG: hypothetical protein MJZ21_04130 [archaeon]|nr:hypothetical protein [archaeon]
MHISLAVKIKTATGGSQITKSNSRPQSVVNGKSGHVPYIQVAVLVLEVMSLLTVAVFAVGISDSGSDTAYGAPAGDSRSEIPTLVGSIPETRIWGDMVVEDTGLFLEGTRNEIDLTLVSGLDYGEFLIAENSTPISVESTVPLVVQTEHNGVFCFRTGDLTDGNGEFILHLTANYVSSNHPDRIVSIRWVLDYAYLGGIIEVVR